MNLTIKQKQAGFLRLFLCLYWIAEWTGKQEDEQQRASGQSQTVAAAQIWPF